MAESYDALVLGVGGVGSAALFHLATRGLRVLGIDRFSPGHDRGSSHGQTRLIRQAYYEHPAYVPLVQRAYALWSDLEQCSGRTLYRQVGILEAGPASGAIVPGVLASARQHKLPVEPLDAVQLKRRFPGFDVPDDFTAVFEARAGFSARRGLCSRACGSGGQQRRTAIGRRGRALAGIARGPAFEWLPMPASFWPAAW